MRDRGRSKGGVRADASDRRQDDLERLVREIQIRDRISRIFLTVDGDRVFTDTLTFIREVFESDLGTFGHHRDDGTLVIPAVTRDLYSERCGIAGKEAELEAGRYGGLWQRARDERRTLYDNTGPFSTPLGHVTITNMIVAPVIFNDRPSSSLLLANKNGGYDEEDRRLLSIIAAHVAPIVAVRLDRDRQTRRLRASEGRYRSLFENSNDAIFVHHLEEILAVNWRACDLVRYRPNQLIGKSLFDLLPAGVSQDDRAAFEQFLEDEEARFETVLATATGELRDVEISTRSLDPRGGPAQSIVRDITERKRLERNLRDSEKKYRQLFENESNAIIIVDAQTRDILDVNPAAEELYGHDAAEMKGMKAEQLSAEPNTHVALFAGAAEENHGGAPVRWQVRKDGAVFAAELSARTYEADGRSVVCTIAHDITERLDGERILRESEERYRELIEHMRSGVAVLEAVDEGADFVLTELNRAGEEIDRLSRESVRGEKVTEVFPGFAAGVWLDVFRRVWKSGKAESIPARFYEDGRISVWREAFVYRLGSDEIVVVYEDITERRRLEESLVSAHKMEALGILAGGVAHDMNNVLAVVLGLSSLMARELLPEAPHTTEVREITEACRRGKMLIGNLLRFCRGGDSDRIVFAINETVDALVDLLRRTFPKRIAIAGTSVDADLMVAGDPDLLFQALMNICTNAADAIAERGTVAISCKLVAAAPASEWVGTRAQSGPQVEICVSDDGAGMDDDTVARAFDPFFTTKEAGKGTGLGLATAYGTIGKHDGTIEIESRLGEGTIVTMRLPIVDEMAAARQRTAPPVGKIRTRSILLVDDEPMFRAVGARLLETLGHTVMTAENGRDALEYYERHRNEIDLIFLDLAMPEMDGVECLARVREINDSIEVVVCTGLTEESQSGLMTKLGARAIVRKPFAVGELERVLAEISGD